MTLPVGVSTCSVTWGPFSTLFGDDQAVMIKVSPVLSGEAHHVVWAGTGQSLLDFSKAFTAVAGEAAAFSVPHVDQDGFINSNGDAVKNWAYQVTATIGTVTLFKNFQPIVGQDTIDLDLLPDGSITPGVTAPVAPVFSVNGQTGNVTLAQLNGLPNGGTTGQVLAKASVTDGDVAWVDAASGGGAITSVNGKTGVVVLSASDVGAAPTTRTVNGHALSADVTVSKADVGLSNVDNTADTAKSFAASQISNSTTVGRSVVTAADATAARTAIGAGTSNLAIGTTSTTAMAGNKTAADLGGVVGTGITAVVAITQASYDALGTKDATTLYVING